MQVGALATIHIILYAFAGTAISVLSIWSYYRNKEEIHKGMGTFLFGAGVASVWCYSLVGLTYVTDVEMLIALDKLRLIAMHVSFLAWAAFTSRYSGELKHAPKSLEVIAVSGTLLIVGLILTNHIHGLLWSGVVMNEQLMVPNVAETTLYWVAVGYSYFLFFAGLVMVFTYALTAGELGKQQATFIIGGAALLLIFNVLSIVEVFPHGSDYTPIGIVFLSGAVLYAVLRKDLFKTRPVTKQQILDAVTERVIVFDRRHDVSNVNGGSDDVFKHVSQGDKLDEALPDGLVSDITDRLEELDSQDGTYQRIPITSNFVYEGESEMRHFNVELIPIERVGEKVEQAAIALRDVTEQRREERKLKESNRHLTEFAASLSHDLWEPLRISEAYLDRAENEDNPEHLDTVRQSLDEVREMVDEIVTFAAQHQTPESTSNIDFSDFVRKVWDDGKYADTDAKLIIEESGEIEAETGRLQHLLDHLFDNSVKHNDSSVMIRVGVTDSGFYVEDDGKGISHSRRTEVFETGLTTGKGTGFGLPIVRSISTAHGWSILVTDSEAGGVRFEFVFDSINPDEFDLEDKTVITNEGTSLDIDSNGRPVRL